MWRAASACELRSRNPIIHDSESMELANLAPTPKVRYKGVEFMERSKRGTMKLYFDQKANLNMRLPPKPPNVRTNAALDNYQNDRHSGAMRNILRNSDYPPKPHNEQFQSPLIIRRVKPEARNNFEKHQGASINRLVHSYGKLKRESSPAPAVSEWGKPNFVLDQGDAMNKTIHQYGKANVAHSYVPRVRFASARSNYDRSKAGHLFDLFHWHKEYTVQNRQNGLISNRI
ncbi:hypothetical protein SNEBB_008407 [Seison nebaliae]|nr:hypothetical protein SNEBB_008407 [Seison nebaliae]